MSEGPSIPHVPVERDEHARDYVARLIAIHGLATVNGNDRYFPPKSWTEEEWRRRILEVIPSHAEKRCRDLAEAICSARFEVET